MTQRRSDKHNPRIDEELDQETASLTHGAPVVSRSRGDLRQEDPADDSSATPGPAPAAPHGMTPEGVDLRAELAQSLRPGAFPAHRDRLIEVARAEEAPQWVIAALGSLPADRRFEVVEQISEAIGEPGENGAHRA